MFIWSVSVDIKETKMDMFNSYVIIRCLSEHQNGTGFYFLKMEGNTSVSLYAIYLMNRELTVNDKPSDIRAWFTFSLNNPDLQRCRMLKLLLLFFFCCIQVHLAGVCHSCCVSLQVIRKGEVSCCWICTACKDNEYVQDEFTCKACELGWWPDKELQGRVTLLHISNT